MANKLAENSITFALGDEDSLAPYADSEALLVQVIKGDKSAYYQGASEYLSSLLLNVRFIQAEAQWLPKNVDPLISGDRLSSLLETGIAQPILYVLRQHERADTLISDHVPMYGGLAAPLGRSERRDSERPTRPSQPDDPVLKEFVLDGVVDAFRGEDAVVIFDVDGRDERRLMSAELLRDNRIMHEGESLRLRIQMVARQDRVEIVTRVEPIDEGTAVAHEDLWPDLDIEKFKCLG